ncbi:MAG: ABC transporter ATP-binding protein [Clostridiales bacterium]|jgi:ABC-type lipoprotein export system ATPase subunit|nr:ABC transporter ATP-binding protein [Clostridiales bacterium]
MGLILQCENLTKSFTAGGVKTDVIKGVSLEVEEGEFVAVVGQSGSGKSTLLYLLGGIERPDSGYVSIAGRKLAELSDREEAAMRRGIVSFVWQFDNLVSNLTVCENITLPLLLSGGVKKSEAVKKAAALAERVGVAHVLDKYPGFISGGEQQRAALAKALVTSPKLLFLDEPTGSLDAASGELVMRLIAETNKENNVAVLMVTHSSAHAGYAGRIIRVSDGKIKDE